MKSIVAERVSSIDLDANANQRAVVERVIECAVLQARDDAPHRFLGVVLHVLHVRAHDVEPELLDHLQQLFAPFFVGRDLRSQIGQVLLRVTRRITAGREQQHQLGLREFDPACPRPPCPSTSLKLMKRAPSSSSDVENGGIDPGVVPPISAWCPREPT